ncbi:MAG: PhaM family polyhydroxyalkanoate granule multifunctional regulatory protein [Herbaspirillum sp.]
MLNHNNMPGACTMEFMRRMWGGMGASAMGIPSLSVEEINKQITDLKTMASWLELNMNILRATIQALEVQSATLSTLQAMSATLTPSEGDGAADAASAPPSAENAAEAMQVAGQQVKPMADLQTVMTSSNAWWKLLQEQFQQAVGNVLTDQPPTDEDVKAAVAPKKTTKPRTEAKSRTRAKSGVIQSRQSRPASSKPTSP